MGQHQDLNDLNPGPPACESGVVAITLRGPLTLNCKKIKNQIKYTLKAQVKNSVRKIHYGKIPVQEFKNFAHHLGGAVVLLRGGQGRDDDAEGAEEEGEGLDEEEAAEDDEPVVGVGKVTPFFNRFLAPSAHLLLGVFLFIRSLWLNCTYNTASRRVAF